MGSANLPGNIAPIRPFALTNVRVFDPGGSTDNTFGSASLGIAEIYYHVMHPAVLQHEPKALRRIY
jgi:hypothetical protein